MSVLARRTSPLLLAPVFLFAVGGASVACGPMEPGEVDESGSGIIGGTLDTGDPAVVHLLKASSAGQSGCTASVIAPTLILTAAHCVNTVPGETNVRFGVSTGVDTNATETFLQVKEAHFDPLYNENNLRLGHDIAVVILSEPVAIPPLAINRTPLNAGTIGDEIRLIGYGATDGAARTGSGQRRQVTTQVGGLQDRHLRIDTRQRNVCFGDSGGPAIMRLGEVDTIVGIASFVNSPQDCLGSGFHGRVDLNLEFIEPYLAAANTPAPPEETPADPSTVPVPPTPDPEPETPPPDANDDDVTPPKEEDDSADPGQAPRAPQGNVEDEVEPDRDGAATEVVKPGFRGETVSGSCACVATPKTGSVAVGLALFGLALGLRPRRRRA